MYTTGLIAPCGLTSIRPAKPPFKSQTFISNPSSCLVISEHKKGYRFLTSINGGGLGPFSSTKRDLVVYSGVEPGAPLPSDPSPNSWLRKNWLWGALLAVILPFLRHAWGPLLSFTKKIESAVETAEDVAEAIENVAVEVDKVAEEVAEKLPEGGMLRDAIEFIEDAAEETVKGADLAEEIFNKVEEVEEGVESFMEQGNEKAEEVEDQKQK